MPLQSVLFHEGRSTPTVRMTPVFALYLVDADLHDCLQPLRHGHLPLTNSNFHVPNHDHTKAVRERAAIAIPRYSSHRRRAANARIDAILYALIQESLRGRGAQGSWRRGSGEEEGAEATTAEEGKQPAKRHGSNGVASYLLSNNDVEAVITYVDKDLSGEVDVEVGGSVRPGWDGMGWDVFRVCVRVGSKGACASTHDVPTRRQLKRR